MDYYEENIQVLKKAGFKNTNFGGYGGTRYSNGELDVWWCEWGYARIELVEGDKLIKRIYLGFINETNIEEKLKEAIREITPNPQNTH